MAVNHYSILEKPLITEKSTMMQEQGNRVMFQVKRSANGVIEDFRVEVAG